MRAFIAALILCLTPAAAFAGQTGSASWYAAGSTTANGERFLPSAVSCAHRTLPFGTIVTVTDLDTGATVRCRVNDRGPFIAGRVIDLSAGAANILGIRSRGTARVRLDW